MVTRINVKFKGHRIQKTILFHLPVRVQSLRRAKSWMCMELDQIGKLETAKWQIISFSLPKH